MSPDERKKIQNCWNSSSLDRSERTIKPCMLDVVKTTQPIMYDTKEQYGYSTKENAEGDVQEMRLKLAYSELK